MLTRFPPFCPFPIGPLRRSPLKTVRTSTDVNGGDTYMKRHFIITDRLDRMRDRSNAWVNETTQALVKATTTNTAGRVVKLVKTSSSTYGAALSTEACTAYKSDPFVCYGRTTPQQGLYAHFAIECGTQYYLGTDRYFFAPKNANQTKQPYICAKNLTATPKYTFLGFFQSGTCNALKSLKFDYLACG